MAKAAAEKVNPVSRAINFVGESWEELKKVHPPTRQETMQVTFLVLCLVMLFGIFLGLTDAAVGRIMKWLLTSS